jgi:hypothetical protein
MEFSLRWTIPTRTSATIVPPAGLSALVVSFAFLRDKGGEIAQHIAILTAWRR